MTKDHQLLQFRGAQLGCSFDFQPGTIGDWNTAPTPKEIAKLTIEHRGTDITELMKQLDLYDEVYDEIYENL